MAGAVSTTVVVVALCFLGSSSAQIYRVCAKEGFSQECQGVRRGSSSVSCVSVTDSVDCALKISRGEADFGVFSSEEVVLLAQMQPEVYHVTGSVKHIDRRFENFAFQSVAVVKKGHTGGLNGLKGGNFCHPGYGRHEQLWSSRVLKYFEQKVVYSSRQCVSDSKTPAESDAHALNGFFATACRPGPWTADSVLDAELKTRFKTLCALCGQENGNCTYSNLIQPRIGSSEHYRALTCLTGVNPGSGTGTVAYVAWQHVRDYFASRTDINDYGLLCEDGSVINFENQTQIGSNAPCAWIKQPWSALLSSRAVSAPLSVGLKTWLPNGRAPRDPSSWTFYLDAILFQEPSAVLEFPAVDSTTLTTYVTEGRPIPSRDESSCHAIQRWCTTSPAETLKCSWVQSSLLTIGTEPLVSCIQASSSVDCLKTISENRADFLSIDSNYGYLARRTYDLQNVLYHETKDEHRSRVIVLLKENSTATISRFENLRGKNACFPEYGGIAWVSFLRAAHEREVIATSECDSAVAISEFFGGVCAPGATDEAHSPSKTANVTRLCSVCRSSVDTVVGTTSINELGVVSQTTPELTRQNVCSADYQNRYYATNGTLACIASPHSDVAIIESQYLKSHALAMNLDENQFRVLCRNNSLAVTTGFNEDKSCILSETVDSEIITRRTNPDFPAIRSLMHELNDHFSYTRLIGLDVFGPFNGTEDLLFKDSTIGLTNSDSDSTYVKNYVTLFEHTDKCYGNSGSTTTPAPGKATALKFTLLSTVLVTYIMALFVV